MPPAPAPSPEALVRAPDGPLALIPLHQRGLAVLARTAGEEPVPVLAVRHGRAPITRRHVIHSGAQVVVKPRLYSAIDGCGEDELQQRDD